MGILDEVFKKIDGYREEMIEVQNNLTKIPALGPESGGDGEYEKSLYIKKILEGMGVTIIEVNAEDTRVSSGIRPNIIGIQKGVNQERTVWIMTHIDVVPPGELSLWKSDPYSLWQEEGKIFGRGVEDNHQDMVASLFALKSLLDIGAQPPCNIGLIFVSDEETGSKYGIEHLLTQRKDLFGTQDIYLVPDGGNEDGTMIEIAEKGILWLKFHTTGKQTHGSRPEKGINSFKAASHLIVKLNSLYNTFHYKDPIFSPPVSTFEPTKKESNVPNVNTIPGDDVFYMDSRVLPCYALEDVEAEMKRLVKDVEQEFKVHVEISRIQYQPACPPTKEDATVVRLLKGAIQKTYGKDAEVMGIGGGTVAAFFRKRGFPVAVWSRIDTTAHAPNEYCIIENMIGDCKVFAHILLSAS
ncbi:MAG: M20 family metallo-hydrolase [Thermodesulfobacteriota bacterium]|nr:M20 family metallo-hydrolase [Thermodesulfobacteriota bacterium]